VRLEELSAGLFEQLLSAMLQQVEEAAAAAAAVTARTSQRDAGLGLQGYAVMARVIACRQLIA
jgi:hypothetical protein